MAKPMRAPKAIEKLLSEQGFGRANYNYYIRGDDTLPLVWNMWFFSRDQPGVSVELGVFYFSEKEGEFLVSPMEYSLLRSDDETIRAGASRGDVGAFWEKEMLPHAVEVSIEWLRRLSDPSAILPLYEYVTGANNIPPHPFPELSDYISRKVTPLRLLGQAAYLTVIGEYAKAAELVALRGSNLRNESDSKVLEDVRRERIGIHQEEVDYFKKIGAAMPLEAWSDRITIIN